MDSTHYLAILIYYVVNGKLMEVLTAIATLLVEKSLNATENQ